MIKLKRGDQVFGEAKLKVSSDGGEYGDFDLIECRDGSDPDAAPSMFQAQFIKYGSIVYQHNTPEALGAALVAIDPESTHDAALLFKEDEARRIARSAGILEPSDPVPAPDSPEPEATQQVEEEPEKEEIEVIEEPKKEDPLPEIPFDEETATSTDPVVPLPDTPATTTPPVESGNTSTTTPSVTDVPVEPPVEVITIEEPIVAPPGEEGAPGQIVE